MQLKTIFWRVIHRLRHTPMESITSKHTGERAVVGPWSLANVTQLVSASNVTRNKIPLSSSRAPFIIFYGFADPRKEKKCRGSPKARSGNIARFQAPTVKGTGLCSLSSLPSDTQSLSSAPVGPQGSSFEASNASLDVDKCAIKFKHQRKRKQVYRINIKEGCF